MRLSFKGGLIMELCVCSSLSAITLSPCSFGVAKCHMASCSISAYALWYDATIPKFCSGILKKEGEVNCF
jgi:hypothetical protein